MPTNEDLVKSLGELLDKRGATLAVAESCSGGMLSNIITNIPGCSKYFLEGSIVYSNQSKIKNLNVKSKTIDTYGAVSEETAFEMSEGMIKKSGADLAVSITGIAGPDGGSEEKPVGLVFIGVSTKNKTKVTKYIFKGDRTQIKTQVVTKALELLIEEFPILNSF